MRYQIGVIACTLLALGSASAQAQFEGEARISWDIPSFFSPRAMDDIGLYYTSIEGARGRSFQGLAGIWRQSGNLNLGVRAGFFDLEDIGNTILVGGEFYGPLSRFAPAGFDASWVLGAGAVFGDDYVVASIPLGVSLGMRLGSGGFQVAPYAHPRLAFDILAVGEGNNEQTDTDAAVVIDVGAEVNLGERLILRVGGSLLDRQAFGAGIALRWPRPISVVR